jgi:hypothetical protein
MASQQRGALGGAEASGTSKLRVSAHRFAHPLRPDRIVRAGEMSYRDPSAAIDGAWPAGYGARTW